MTLSVVIATYNPSKNLLSLIDNLCMQITDFNFEVIIVDDASENHLSKEIVDQIDEKIKLLSNFTLHRISKNLGRGRVKNYLIEKSNGEYILFLDDHLEVSDLHFLKNVHTCFIERDVDAVCGSYISTEKNDYNRLRDLRRTIFYKKNKNEKLISNSDWTTFSIVLGAYKKSVFNISKFSKEFVNSSCEDTALQLLLEDKGIKHLYYPKIFGHHNHKIDFWGFIGKSFDELIGTIFLYRFCINENLKIKNLPFFTEYKLRYFLLLFTLYINLKLCLLVYFGFHLPIVLKAVKVTDIIESIKLSLFLVFIDMIKSLSLPFTLFYSDGLKGLAYLSKIYIQNKIYKNGR